MQGQKKSMEYRNDCKTRHFRRLDQLAVLFDEYRQFYGASSDLNLSAAFLKQRFENQESVIFIHIKDQKITGFVLLLFRLFFSCLFDLLYFR